MQGIIAPGFDYLREEELGTVFQNLAELPIQCASNLLGSLIINREELYVLLTLQAGDSLKTTLA